MSNILSVKARQVFDSRGNPTVEAEVRTAKGVFTAIAPSGASVGRHEALELRDGGAAYLGKGVLKAVGNVNRLIAKAIVGMSCINQREIDKTLIELDGTENKSRLGANATIAVSMAVCRAGAAEQRVPLYEHIARLFKNKRPLLPMPAFNIINGGRHAGNKLDFQEYLLIPKGAKSFAEAIQIATEVYHILKDKLDRDLGTMATNVGDEGGFAPQLNCIEEPFDYILDAVNELGYWKKIGLGVDAAATTFREGNAYRVEGQSYTTPELIAKYEELTKSYPLISIEDPFHEEAFEDFAELNVRIGKRVQVVGDDLLTTNILRIKKALLHSSCTCLLLKPNQIGTLTESFEAAKVVLDAGWSVMVSHRSGESEDAFIADLAVGLGAGQIKAGAPCRGERLAKYNRLLRIEEELGRKAKLAKFPK
ncbi:MAG: phosphopyruvate hydratase [Candidatus Woesearchaeota archaeon]